MKSKDNVIQKIKEEFNKCYSAKIKMLNYLDNSRLEEKYRKKYIYISIEDTSKYFESSYLCVKDFFAFIRRSPNIMYKILKYAKKENITESFIYFITNNFYRNILSPEYFSEEMFIIIEQLLFDVISGMKTINDFYRAIDNSNFNIFIQGLKYQKEIQMYFDLIIGNIIETYEISGENKTPLIFKVNDLINYIKQSEEDLIHRNFSLDVSHTIDEERLVGNNGFHNIYKRKLFDLDGNHKNKQEILTKDYREYDTFTRKYLADFTEKEFEDFKNNNIKNEPIADYINVKINIFKENPGIFSNQGFLENIQRSKKSDKVLFYFQKNFNIAMEIIHKIFRKFIINFDLIPYQIKCICRIIFIILKIKFPEISTKQRYIYLCDIFFVRIFKMFFLHPDYNSFTGETIISQTTKDNLVIIFDIWKKFISTEFYVSNKDYADYTPFNHIFLDLIPSLFQLCEKLIKVNLPKSLNICNENVTVKKFRFSESIRRCSGKKQYFNTSFDSYSICYNINDLTTLLNIIKHNYKDFFNDLDKIDVETFQKIYNKLKSEKEIFKILKEKDKNTINYYLYYEILFPDHIKNILDNKISIYEMNNFKLEEIKKEQTQEDTNNNKIIKTKNLLSDLLFTCDFDNIKLISRKVNYNNLKDIFLALDEYVNTFDDEDENFHNHNISTLPPSWYISSLMISLEQFDNTYSQNDFSELIESLSNSVKESIEKYDFEILAQIIESLIYCKKITNLYENDTEKYKIICSNSKIKKFIENAEIEVKVKIKYSLKEKKFSVKKRTDNKIGIRYLQNMFNVKTKNKNKIKCNNITEFIEKFPDLNLLKKNQDDDVFVFQKEINLSSGLTAYFNIIKESIDKYFLQNEAEMAFNKIKQNILIKIYDKLFPKEPSNDDLTFHYRTLSLSWVEPHHLNQSKYHFDNFLPITTSYFNLIDNEKSPTAKFEIIDKIFGAIENVLSINFGEDYDDTDLLSICEYALIRAHPERLYSNISYLQMFISENTSEVRIANLKYLRTSMNTIKNCKYQNFLGVTEKEFQEKCIEAKNKAFNEIREGKK